MKEFVYAVIINLFLGYLWVLFIDHIIKLANQMSHKLVFGGLISLVGTLLFWEIAKHATPSSDHKLTHPVKITGFASFILAVIIVFFHRI